MACAVLGCVLTATAHAVTTTSAPMGGLTIKCKANSDTAVGIPLTRPDVFEGRVNSVDGNSVTVAGTPGWMVDQFVYEDGTQDNHYYLLFASGAKEGAFYTITGNSSNSVSIDLNPFMLDVPDSLDDVSTGGPQTGDIVRINTATGEYVERVEKA